MSRWPRTSQFWLLCSGAAASLWPLGEGRWFPAEVATFHDSPRAESDLITRCPIEVGAHLQETMDGLGHANQSQR